MTTAHTILASLALTLILAGCLAGCASGPQRAETVTEADSTREAASEQVASRSSEPTVRVPSEDAPGREIPGLPRYPGSVRVEYERGQRGSLEMVRARYLTRDGLNAVRGYYRGVFRAEAWEVANAEFYEDEWTFLAVHGEREADIEIEAHQGGVTEVDIELSEPLPEDVASKKAPQEKESSASRAPSRPPQPAEQARPVSAPQSASPSLAPQSASPAPQSASPAPQPSSPAPDPGYYGGGDDDWDDFGDDGGGDDDEGGDD